jgi:tape measure domain-containing protein
MAGPIATAFVEIIAKLELDKKSKLDSDLRSVIRGLEDDLNKLEGAAFRTGRAIARQLEGVRVNLDVRDAVSDLSNIETAAGGVSEQLRDLRGKNIGFDTAAVTRDINRIDELLRSLVRSVQVVDGEEIDLDVTDTTRQLRNLERATVRIVNALDQISSIRARPQVDGARADIERLQAVINQALLALGRIDQSRVRVKVDDLELEQLEAEVRRLDAQVVDITVRADESGVNRISRGVERLNVNLNDFGDQFRNIAFRAVSFLAIGQAIQGLQRIIQLGIESAGAIQTVTVSLNRLFADMTELGQSASDFIGDLRRVAIQTPFEFLELAETSIRLVQLGGDAETAITRMEQLADAGAAVGATSDDINGVVRALSQLRAKGRLNLQDLNQIAERLPNFQRQLQLQGVNDELEALQSPLAGTIDSFDELRTSGVGIDTIINGLFRGLSEIPGAAGAAAAQARTLEGSLSNLKDFMEFEFASAFRFVGETLADELNAAFGEITGETQQATSQLGDAFIEVIGAFGVAADRVLPSIIDYTSDISDELADLATAGGALIESLAEGFTGDIFEGMIDGLTNVIAAATLANNALSILPAGVSEGIGKVAVQLILLSRLFGPGVVRPFTSAINDLTFSFSAVRGGAATAREAISNLAPSFGRAAAAAAGIAAVTIALDQMAQAARRAREVEQSINVATLALEEFSSVGEAAVEFLDDFRQAGEGINIGSLERLFNGLTTTDLERQLGLSADELGRLVSELADLEDLNLEPDTGLSFIPKEGLNGAEDALAVLERYGVSFEDIIIAGGDVRASLEAVVEQFDAAAEAALNSGINSRRWGLVSERAADQVLAEANATGEYVKGLERINELQNEAAERKVDTLADTLGLKDFELTSIVRQFQDAQTGTTDWIGVLGNLEQQLLAIDDASDALSERAPDFVAFVDSFDVRVTEGGLQPVRTLLTNLALYADELDLTADEYEALADRLGSALTGEELAEFLPYLAERVEEFAETIEGVLPSMESLQIEADEFSLNKLIRELEKIGEARAEVSTNLNLLLDEFGDAGARSIEALLESNLDPDQFALAVQQLVDGGIEDIGRINEAFGAITGGEAQELAERLVAFGLTPEQARAVAGADLIEAELGNIDTTEAEEILKGLYSRVMAPFTQKGMSEQTKVRFPILFEDASNVEIPDTVREDLEAAWEVQGFAIGKALLAAAGKEMDLSNDAFRSRGYKIAETVVDAIAKLLPKKAPLVSVEMRNVSKVAGDMATPQAKGSGTQLGLSIGSGVADGIYASTVLAVIAIARLVELTYQAARQAAKAKSPSQLFADLGKDLGAGLAVGLTASIPDVSKAAEQLTAATAVPTASLLAKIEGASGTGGGGVQQVVDLINAGRGERPAAAAGARDVQLVQHFHEKQNAKLIASEIAWELS